MFPTLHRRDFLKTGERAMIPGVNYSPASVQDDLWKRRCQAAWEYHQAHPNGPHVYGGWDAVPPRAQTQATHARWLKQYLPLVEDGTWAWLEIGASDLFLQPLPKGVVASVFANREVHLVLANYGKTPAEIATSDPFVPVSRQIGTPARTWTLGPRSLHILRRSE